MRSMLRKDTIELEVDGAFEADARNVGPVEEDVSDDRVEEENEGGEDGENRGQVGAEGGTRDEGRDGFEDDGLQALDKLRSCCLGAYFDRR